MTTVLLLALGAALAWGALAAARRAPALPGRAIGGGALLAAAIGLAALRQFALAVPLGMLAIGMLRTATAAARAIPQPGRRSDVRTDALAMTLDHDTGRMDGEVLRGRFEGARLSDLSLADLAALADEIDADADSLGLLLAYLDRRRGADDADGAAREEAPQRPGGPEMSEDEALRILGLAPGAGVDEVRDAHRRLMRKVHPDLGGSDALAAMINAAKARLDP